MTTNPREYMRQYMRDRRAGRHNRRTCVRGQPQRRNLTRDQRTALNHIVLSVLRLRAAGLKLGGNKSGYDSWSKP